MNANGTTQPRRARYAMVAGAVLGSLALAGAGIARAAGGAERPPASQSSSATPLTPKASGNPSTSDESGPGSRRSTDTAVDTEALHRPTETVDSSTDTGQWASMQEFMEFVIHNTDRFWTATLTAEGRAEPQVRYQLPEPGVSVATDCGPSNDTSMFYCPSDDTIVFSQKLAQDLWNGNYRGPDGQSVNGIVGDFATAVMLAHEFAHSIQSEVGITPTQYGVPRAEKHADCWAGVWANSAYRQGILDANDINEALWVTFLVGDSQYTDANHHGDSAERQAAFMLGYNSGAPITCDTYLVG